MIAAGKSKSGCTVHFVTEQVEEWCILSHWRHIEKKSSALFRQNTAPQYLTHWIVVLFCEWRSWQMTRITLEKRFILRRLRLECFYFVPFLSSIKQSWILLKQSLCSCISVSHALPKRYCLDVTVTYCSSSIPVGGRRTYRTAERVWGGERWAAEMKDIDKYRRNETVIPPHSLHCFPVWSNSITRIQFSSLFLATLSKYRFDGLCICVTWSLQYDMMWDGVMDAIL